MLLAIHVSRESGACSTGKVGTDGGSWPTVCAIRRDGMATDKGRKAAGLMLGCGQRQELGLFGPGSSTILRCLISVGI